MSSNSSLPSGSMAEMASGPEGHYRSLVKQLLGYVLATAPAKSSVVDKLKTFKSVLNGGDPESLDAGEFQSTLAECLRILREELASERQAAQNAALAMLPPDSATGLPGPAAAIQLLSTRIREGSQTFVAVLVLDQLRALNARFGRTVGDEVLLLAAGDLSRELGNSGTLYRWRGPAFLAISTKGKAQADSLQSDIEGMAGKRLEKTIGVENRSIHLKITFSWDLQQVNLKESADAATRLFDDFVAASVGGGLNR